MERRSDPATSPELYHSEPALMNIRSSAVLRNLSLLMLVIAALYLARAFLVPVFISTLLAMLLLPVCRWMERKGIGKGWAAFLSMLILVFVAAGILIMIGWQVQHLTKDLSMLREKTSGMLEDVRGFIFSHSGLSFSSQPISND